MGKLTLRTKALIGSADVGFVIYLRGA